MLRRSPASIISTFRMSSSSAVATTPLFASLRYCSSSSSTPPPPPPPKGSNEKEEGNTKTEEGQKDAEVPSSASSSAEMSAEKSSAASSAENSNSSSSSSSTSTNKNTSNSTPASDAEKQKKKEDAGGPPKGFELFHAPFFKKPLTPDSPSVRNQPQPTVPAHEHAVIHASDRDVNRRHKNLRAVQVLVTVWMLYFAWRFWHRGNTRELGGESFYYYEALRKADAEKKAKHKASAATMVVEGQDDGSSTSKTAATAEEEDGGEGKRGETTTASSGAAAAEEEGGDDHNNDRLLFLPTANVRYITVSPEAHSADFYAEDGRKLFTQRFIDFKHWLADIKKTATAENGPFVRTEVIVTFPFVAIAFLWLMPILGRFYRSVQFGLGAARNEAHAAIRRQQSMSETETPNKGRFRFKKENEVTTRLEDVAGLTEAKHEVTEIVDFLRAPDKYEILGAKLPKGVLIDGPPGVGKTLLARAVAGEAGLNFVSCSGSEFDEVYVGVGAMRVRELFKSARENAPCVVFIDEIDTFGKKRRRDARGSSRGTINALLSELDGFKEASRIMVLAATNRADILDDALTRSGRFDRKITVDLPPLKDRIAIALVHLKPLRLAPGLGVQKVAGTLAALTPGCSGADIYNVCNEAAIVASRLHKEHGVDMECFHKAMDRIMIGLERKARKFEQHERERLAIHEAGHVVLSWFLKTTDPVMKVTIAPRGGSAEGKSRKLPHEKFIITQDSLHERMVQHLGGYVAEEYFFHDVSANAAEDLAKVTQQAHAEICTYGMAPEIVGHFGFPNEQTGGGDAITQPYGPEKSNVVDREIATLVNSVSDRAREMLKQYITEVRTVAGLLLKQESMTAKELWVILGPRPNMTKEFRDYLESDSS